MLSAIQKAIIPAAIALSVALGLAVAARQSTARSAADPVNRDFGRAHSLPLPSTLSVTQFEEKLFEFLNNREYHKLGWLRDKSVRDTGSYIGGKYYGTHPAVRVYYSPGVIKWLLNDRAGKIPDGEMIIKEQYAPPGIRHQTKSDDELWKSLESWTVMIKDSSGSHDGWFWSNPVKGQCTVDSHRYPYDYPVSGFGQYCVRCHAATQSPGVEPASAANEYTFAHLRNITGFPGQPMIFRVDDTWRAEAAKEQTADARTDAHPKCARPEAPPKPVHVPNPRFLSFFSSIKTFPITDVAHLPPVTHDWVVSRRDTGSEFMTSNQCMNCHSGLTAPFGPSMFVPTGPTADYGAPGWDVSPYGEWRFTPMGLAGRDPIFFAQLECEIALLRGRSKDNPAAGEEVAATLVDACLRCHGAMGRRQFGIDHPDGKIKMSIDHIHAIGGVNDPLAHGDSKYGALAREGISCVVCHRMQPRPQPAEDKRPYLQFFLETSLTGNYNLGPRGEIYGPFKDNELSPYTMEHGTGIKPKHSDYLKSSQLCGTCHAVILPSVEKPLGYKGKFDPDIDVLKTEVVPLFRNFHHHVEQATYLEWLNSEFENEINPQNPKAKSCQDCHMNKGVKDPKHKLDVPQLRSRIAAVQDSTYPDAENLAPHEQLNVRLREDGYKRHNFSGLNAFLMELFNQFDDVLGVPKVDFMTGSKEPIAHAIESVLQTARDEVATIDVKTEMKSPTRLSSRVLVSNKVGHRFPSGVGFRRAFLEFDVVEKAATPGGTERLLWSSGRTNELGVILGADGRPLPTEFFDKDSAGQQQWQKHHTLITSPSQVQIYEALNCDIRQKFTVSFVGGCDEMKDNRLLPRGWKPNGPGPALSGAYLNATHPDPETEKDPHYADGSGSHELTYQIDLPPGIDTSRLQVRVTLYYQAIPPRYLKELFETSPNTPAIRRLHYLCSHANLKGTPLENWKLKVTSATSDVGR
jgi:hypothetical protein